MELIHSVLVVGMCGGSVGE